MKATGEVMAIGQSFEEALMKAVRGAEIGLDTLNAPPLTNEPVSVRLKKQDDRRLFTVFEALKAGMTVDAVFALTKIDRWFLTRLQAMAMLENRINHTGLQVGNYEQLKRWGYPDGAIRRLFHTDHLPDIAHISGAEKLCHKSGAAAEYAEENQIMNRKNLAAHAYGSQFCLSEESDH